MKLASLNKDNLPWLLGGLPNWTHGELAEVPLLEGAASDYLRRWVLAEAPHTAFDAGSLPAGFRFLDGKVDLGFENLGPVGAGLNLAFSKTGVRIPGTNLKLMWGGRNDPSVFAKTTVEDDKIPELPPNWTEAVLVLAHDYSRPTWIGKRVREDQVAGFDLSGYRDIGSGWVPAEI